MGYECSHGDYGIAVKAGRKPSLGDRGLLYAELEECVEGQLGMLVIDDWDPVQRGMRPPTASSSTTAALNASQCSNKYYEDLARALDEVADLEYLLEIFSEEIRCALTRPDI